MTGEEMERAIETILSNQANFELQLERTNKQLETLAETQNEFTQVVMRHIEAQGEFNARTDGRLNSLINTVERLVSEGRNGKS